MKYFCYGILICVILLNILGACVDKKEQYVRQWYGKTLLFPDSIVFRLFAREKVFFDYTKTKYKLAVFIGDADCISCKLKIDDWLRFKQDLDSTSSDITFLFIMNPIYRRELYTVLKSYNFSTSVCIDNSKEIRTLNNIPLNTFHVFLLDWENKIIGVGDPIANIKVRNLYKKCILTK